LRGAGHGDICWFHQQIARRETVRRQSGGGRARSNARSLSAASGHFEIFQNAVIHQDHALARHAFVVKLVVTEQNRLSQFSLSGIVTTVRKLGKNLFVNFWRRSGPRSIFLAMASARWPKNFVKE